MRQLTGSNTTAKLRAYFSPKILAIAAAGADGWQLRRHKPAGAVVETRSCGSIIPGDSDCNGVARGPEETDSERVYCSFGLGGSRPSGGGAISSSPPGDQ